MTTPRDAYWDELGIAWCAIEPEVNAMTPRLEARLRRQSLLITAVLILGLPLVVAGMLVGMLTIWSGFATGAWNFVTRGVAAFGLVGTATRAYLTRPPRMSPLIDLAILAIFALGLFLFGRRVRINLEKLRYLKRVLAVDGGA